MDRSQPATILALGDGSVGKTGSPGRMVLSLKHAGTACLPVGAEPGIAGVDTGRVRCSVEEHCRLGKTAGRIPDPERQRRHTVQAVRSASGQDTTDRHNPGVPERDKHAHAGACWHTRSAGHTAPAGLATRMMVVADRSLVVVDGNPNRTQRRAKEYAADRVAVQPEKGSTSASLTMAEMMSA